MHSQALRCRLRSRIRQPPVLDVVVVGLVEEDGKASVLLRTAAVDCTLLQEVLHKESNTIAMQLLNCEILGLTSPLAGP